MKRKRESFTPLVTEASVYNMFLEENANAKALSTALNKEVKELISARAKDQDKNYNPVNISIKDVDVVSVGSDSVRVGELSKLPAFFFPIFGVESVGKSTFASRLAATLVHSCKIDIKRIQCENTVMPLTVYNLLPPINKHRVQIHQVDDESSFVRVFPSLITEDDVKALLKIHPHVLIDGCARIRTTHDRLAERGININALEFGMQEVPSISSGAIVVFTITSDNIRKDMSAASQGYIEIINRDEAIAVSPFNRQVKLKSDWNGVLDNFFSLNESGRNYNAHDFGQAFV